MSIVVDRCYAENRAAYRFLVLKSDVLSCNTIVETKNVEFLENVFPLKTKTVRWSETCWTHCPQGFSACRSLTLPG